MMSDSNGKHFPSGRMLYEEIRLLTKDTHEASRRLKRICKNPDAHYVFINDHIGDVILSLGYLKAFKEKNGFKQVIIITTGQFTDLADCYKAYWDDIVCIPQYDLYRIFLLNATRYGQLYLKKKYPNVTFVNPADAAVLGFEYLQNYPELTLEKMIRYGCFGLDNKAEFIPLPMPEKMNDPKENPGRNALIITDARTLHLKSTEIFEVIADGLKKNGYTVYSNTPESKDCINGTMPLYADLNELRMKFNEGIVVGARCGLHDLMLYQDCKVIALYPEKDRRNSLFTLSAMPDVKAGFLEVELSDDIRSDGKKILEFIKG